VTFFGLVVFGYLVGSCPWGYWLVRVFRGEDIRRSGSGNIGATNVWRTYGRSLGVPVVLLDLLKGFAPALVGVVVVSHLCGIAAGAAAMLGHWRPLYLRFEKGGKMVATGAGVFLAVAPWVGLEAGVAWFTIFLLTRYASVASIGAALSLPVTAAVIGYPAPVIGFAAAAAAGVVVLHRGNLRRLRAGTERRVRLRRTAQV
jgi:acyl phosphate:glycerol-3-phosphate acyltransferase